MYYTTAGCIVRYFICNSIRKTKLLKLGFLYSFVLIILFTPTFFFYAADEFQEITVKAGDTSWSIAHYYLKDPQRWPEILKSNNLSSQDVVLPGMKIKVPILLIKEQLRAASLKELKNDVQYRLKETVSWKKAQDKMKLYNEDSVKTNRGSYAEVEFYSGEDLNINENSLVILRPEIKREEIELVLGEIRTGRSKVMTKTTQIVSKSNIKGETDIRTKVDKDNTTSVAAIKGEAEVTSAGKTITVPEGFGTEVKYLQTPSLPTPLPPLPKPTTGQMNIDVQFPDFTVTPKLSAKINITNQGKVELSLPKDTQLTYQPPNKLGNIPALPNDMSQQYPARNTEGQKTAVISRDIRYKKYRLQISTDSLFRPAIVDEVNKIGQNTIDLKRNFKDGIYYWRVAYIDSVGLESQFSESQMYGIDTMPPTLIIESPKNDNAVVNTDFVYFKGKTEPGVELRFDDKVSFVDSANGYFETALLLPEGRIPVKITARDSYGNETALTRTVIKKGQSKSLVAKDSTEIVKFSTDNTKTNYSSHVITGAQENAGQKTEKKQNPVVSLLISILAGSVIFYVILFVIL